MFGLRNLGSKKIILKVVKATKAKIYFGALNYTTINYSFANIYTPQFQLPTYYLRSLILYLPHFHHFRLFSQNMLRFDSYNSIQFSRPRLCMNTLPKTKIAVNHK